MPSTSFRSLQEEITNLVDAIHETVTSEIERQLVRKTGISLMEYRKIDAQIHEDRVFNAKSRELFRELHRLETLIYNAPIFDMVFHSKQGENTNPKYVSIQSRFRPVQIRSITCEWRSGSMNTEMQSVTLRPNQQTTVVNYGYGDPLRVNFEKPITLPFSVHIESEVGNQMYRQSYVFDGVIDCPEVYFNTREELHEKRESVREALGLQTTPEPTPDMDQYEDVGSFYIWDDIEEDVEPFPSEHAFLEELEDWINYGVSMKRAYVDICAADIHKRLGGYPGNRHRLSVCCRVMKERMKEGDEIISQSKRGGGANFIVRYFQDAE